MEGRRGFLCSGRSQTSGSGVWTFRLCSEGKTYCCYVYVKTFEVLMEIDSAKARYRYKYEGDEQLF